MTINRAPPSPSSVRRFFWLVNMKRDPDEFSQKSNRVPDIVSERA